MNKKMRILGLAAATALFAVGCSNDDKGSDGADGSVEIRFATWDSESSLDRQQDLVDRFNESQDDIHVKLEGYGGEFDTNLTAGMGAGDAPDVMYMWNYPTYHEGLEPLDDFIDSEGQEYKDNFYETTWNYNAINDNIYGIPVGFTTHALYYNIDLFEEAGVDLPEDDWTWDDVREASEKITDKDKNVYGLVLPIKPDPYDFEMYYWSNDTAYANEDGETQDMLNSPEGVEVLETFQDLLKDEIAIASDGYGTDQMEAGTSAMMVSGAWEMQSFAEAEINYGLVPIPSFDDQESVSILSSSGLAMSADSEHQDEAWEFIKFWTNEEANRERLEYELPVLKSVVEEEGLEEGNRGVFYTMLERSEDLTPTSFIVDNWSTLSDDLSLVFESVFNPSSLKDPKEALEEAVQ